MSKRTPRECYLCHEVKIISARNLCSSCYYKMKQAGRLGEFEKAHVKRYGCSQCGEYERVYGRNMCKECYMRWYQAQPHVKAKHAEYERGRRKKYPEKYREYDARRQKTIRRIAWRTEYNRRYYRANAEALKEYQRQWRRDNPERRDAYKAAYDERKASLPDTLTSDEWKHILKDYHHLCVYCGASDRRLEEDHWVPVSLGGGRTADNIVPACHSCNSRKADLPAEIFLDILDVEEWETIERLAGVYCQ